jgi:hypothetical protein
MFIFGESYARQNPFVGLFGGTKLMVFSIINSLGSCLSIDKDAVPMMSLTLFYNIRIDGGALVESASLHVSQPVECKIDKHAIATEP